MAWLKNSHPRVTRYTGKSPRHCVASVRSTVTREITLRRFLPRGARLRFGFGCGGQARGHGAEGGGDGRVFARPAKFDLHPVADGVRRDGAKQFGHVDDAAPVELRDNVVGFQPPPVSTPGRAVTSNPCAQRNRTAPHAGAASGRSSWRAVAAAECPRRRQPSDPSCPARGYTTWRTRANRCTPRPRRGRRSR